MYVLCTPYSNSCKTSITDSLTDDHVDARLCRHIPASRMRQRGNAERWLSGVCSATSGLHSTALWQPGGWDSNQNIKPSHGRRDVCEWHSSLEAGVRITVGRQMSLGLGTHLQPMAPRQCSSALWMQPCSPKRSDPLGNNKPALKDFNHPPFQSHPPRHFR